MPSTLGHGSKLADDDDGRRLGTLELDPSSSTSSPSAPE
jgi:hypothetical protein